MESDGDESLATLTGPGGGGRSISSGDYRSVESGGSSSFRSALLGSERKNEHEGLDFDAAHEVRGSTLPIRSYAAFALVGACTGIAAFIIDSLVADVTKRKYDAVDSLLSSGGNHLHAFGVLLAYALPLGFAAALMVEFVSSAAAGSGIPEAKAYLNGTSMPGFLEMRTLAAKALGVVAAVSSGLIIGKEGPLVHIGAILGAHVNRLPFLSPPVSGFKTTLKTESARRDLVSGGAAAGVAGAFGTPIGGILFSLEEASSFWSLALTWRTYLSTLLTVGVLWFLLSWNANQNSFYGLVKYGQFENVALFRFWEAPLVLALAVFGGLIGALFCCVNVSLAKWRRRIIGSFRTKAAKRWFRIIEVLVIVLMTNVLMFWTPRMLQRDRCVEAVPNYLCSGLDNKYYCGTPGIKHSDLSQNCTYSCPDISQYRKYECSTGANPLATLTLQKGNDAIKALFHNAANFGPMPLFGFCILCFLLGCVTYGSAVPSGLFVPCILIGGSMGRCFGELLVEWGVSVSSPSMYALVGASAVLSGVTRITITISVILYETTDKVYLILPIMACVIISKWVADCFNISLYDSYIELARAPFVESAAPARFDKLSAKDIMSSPPVVFRERETLSNILAVFVATRHNGFPVVGPKGRYAGMVLRDHIIAVMIHYLEQCRKCPAVMKPNVFSLLEDDREGYLLEADLVAMESSPTFSRRKSRAFRVLRGLSDDHAPLTDLVTRVSAQTGRPASQLYVCLSDICTMRGFAVADMCPATRCHQLFRHLGLRHLAVRDEERGTVCGVITRSALMATFESDLH